MKRQIIIGVLSALALGIILGGVKFFQISRAIAQHAGFKPPPEAITSAVVHEETWPALIDAVGSLAPVQGVILSAEESGKISTIDFKPGAWVEKGTILVELDTTVEEADHERAKVKWEWAQRSLERTKTLRTSNFASQQTLEDAESEVKQAKAQCESLMAAIYRKKIIAPFAGRVGIRTVTVGQYVKAGDQIVPLQDTKNLFLNLSVPQRESGKINAGTTVKFQVDSFPTEEFSASVSATNPQVDMMTRSISIQATVSNLDEKLKPGMFAKAQVVLSELTKALVVPISAISFASYGDSVFVLESMKRPDGSEYKGARQQGVKVGERRGEVAVILSGINAGQEVASTGLFKLREGAEVLVNNKIVPGESRNPQPSDS